LTRELVGHELRTSPDPAADVVRRALVVLPSGVPVTVRLHPDVAASTVAADLAGLAGPAGQQLTVVPDAGLERDDAVVETAEQVVDLCVGAALERVAEALR
ncbi:FliH/SctL family protein, partial [Nocardioides kribbensis]|uniref:FliH/SctL family protein n=1 Tax=Nocardioides kribbensis TaxID=305517 RepID=UPI0032DABC1F